MGQNNLAKRRYDETSVLNHQLAVMIHFAFHDPQNMPEPQIISEIEAARPEISSDADDVQAFFQNLAKGR